MTDRREDNHRVALPWRPAKERLASTTGARRGQVRWSLRLPTAVPEDRRASDWVDLPVLRSDGAILLAREGLISCVSPEGAILWERPLHSADADPWERRTWASVLCLDAADGAWLVTRAGLVHVAADGEAHVVAPGLEWRHDTVALPWGGFARNVGLDPNYYTGHYPCCSSNMALYDTAGEEVARYEERLAPGSVRCVGSRVTAAFYDAAHGPPGEVILVLDQRGRVLERAVRGDESQSWHRWREEVLRRHAEAQGLPPPPVAPREGLDWQILPPTPTPERHLGFGTAIRWEEGLLLQRYAQGVEPETVLRHVSADPPAIDSEGCVFVTRTVGDEIVLTALRDGREPLFDAPLAPAEEVHSLSATPHGGRPASQWRAMGWFHAPVVVGPSGHTTALVPDPRGATLHCVE